MILTMTYQDRLQQPISHEDLFELLAYLIMSARTGLAHPLEYNLFRTISAAAKLAEAWLPTCPEEHKAFLTEFLDQSRKESGTFQSDPEVFREFLTHISRELAVHTRQLGWGDEGDSSG